MKKAAFFDRDGTLIHDVNYLAKLDDIKLIPQAVRIARLCMERGYTVFVVTNQSGVARGFFDEDFVHKTHQFLSDELAGHGVKVEEYYYCPHHPTQAVDQRYKQDCNCRKPSPGMLLQAAQEHNIDLSSSLMFGDKALDLDAGRAAGCKSYDITKLIDLSDLECAKLLNLE